jgi:hypothetical protein
VSSLRSEIAFYTGPAFINIVNPASNSVKFYGAIRKEFTTLRRAYPDAHLNFRINNPILMMKERLSRIALKLKSHTHPDPSSCLNHYEQLVKKGLEVFHVAPTETYTIIDSLHR